LPRDESFSTTRDKAAALKFIKRTMKRHGKPRTVVTDGLRSYPAAMNEIGNGEDQQVGRWLNNRAKNSHQPFRRRERATLRFRRMKIRGRDVHCWTLPAQIRTGGIPAYGSYLGCLTAKH
jgi:transposase-like protein